MAKNKYSYWRTALKMARQLWARSYPARRECFARAKVKGNDNMDKWICAKCSNLFALSEVECDHKIPIENTIPISEEEFEICHRRLHCGIEYLQILCKKDHKAKTKKEMEDRKRADLLKQIFGHVGNSGYNVYDNPKLNDMKVLKKFAYIIKNINSQTGDKKEKAIAKFQLLLEQYL